MSPLRATAVFGVLLFAGIAYGDTETDAARRLYVSATKHFDLNEYESALNDFKEGFRHKDDPVFLYNIAQCYRLLGKNEDALKFYRTYLRREPNASNRDEVERRIANLQELIASTDRARSAPPPGVVQPRKTESPREAPVVTSTTTSPQAMSETTTAHKEAPKKPVYKRWWFWTTVGLVVAAGVGVGVGVGLSQDSPRSYPGVTF